jgi:hypothetical protein
MRWKVAASLLSILLVAPVVARSAPAVSIEEIVANGHISGKVTGIDPSAAGKFCVVVYVKTDIWYIHPFASGGEGKSWAKIEDGAWTIKTVKRDFPADEVAALIVARDSSGRCSGPPRTDEIESIEHVAIVRRDVSSGVDHGKL